MDRNTWMYTIERFTVNYMKGLSEIIKCTEDHREKMRETKISCPCKECRNIVSFADPNMIRRHLIEHGFDKNYTCWDLHGETLEPQVDSHTFVSDTNHEENDSNDDNHRDNLDKLLHDPKINVDEKNVKKFQQLFVEAEKALYNGCPKQPRNDIDVYLRPLNDDMIDLWEKGVEIYDAYKKESFLGLLLNIPGKTKDVVNARKDMVEMGIRNELAPQVTNETKMYLPPACYTLSKAEKTSFCECLHGVKVPSGYSSNIKNFVSMKDLKLLEIKLAGLVFLRYMYPFERFMGFLKGYVRNRYRAEGSIVQGLDGVGTIGRKDVTPTNDDFEQAHFTVLQNITCIEPYIHEHMSYLVENNSRRDQRWLEAEHKRTFSQWLANKVIRTSPTNVDADVIQLGYRPHSSRMTIAKTSYYGVVDEIWELDYTSIVIPLLKYKWVDNTRGVKVDRDGFTCVNLSTNGYLSNPFILAKQATQVLYVKDPKDKRWHIVLQSKWSIVGVDDVVDEDEYNKFDELPPFSIDVQSTDDVLSDTLYLRSDHQEGHED
nr:hypothetical protein [Tanacetum cinerariifolium]